jgi:TatD DNase family protein
MLFDSHCHLDHPVFAARLPALLIQAQAAGVGGFLVPGVAPAGWEGSLTLAGTFPQLRTALGVHPMHAPLLDPDTLSRLDDLAPEATAIGEIGLDYGLEVPRGVQQEAFRAQLRIARRHRLPVLIHCRLAFADLLTLLGEEGVREGVMHAFSGSVETAGDCLKLGFHISLAGTVTYPNAVRPLAVARFVPIEHLLIETDAPDLTPVPHRGETNLPAYLRHTASRIALLRGLSLTELARATSDNAARLFRIG